VRQLLGSSLCRSTCDPKRGSRAARWALISARWSRILREGNNTVGHHVDRGACSLPRAALPFFSRSPFFPCVASRTSPGTRTASRGWRLPFRAPLLRLGPRRTTPGAVSWVLTTLRLRIRPIWYEKEARSLDDAACSSLRGAAPSLVTLLLCAALPVIQRWANQSLDVFPTCISSIPV